MIKIKKLGELTQFDKIKLFTALGVILTLVIGTIDHFIYEWTGNNTLIGIFAATNESIWEHVKLALFPMLVIFLLGGFLFSKKVNNYFLAVFCALSVMILFIVFGFLGYTMFTRKAFLPLDISIFTSGIILGYLTAYRIFFMPKRKLLNYFAVVGILFIVAVFLTCTYHAPDFFLFRELYVK